MKRYIILGKNRKTGEWVGYVEKSFSMDFDPQRVRIWNSVYPKYQYTKEEKEEAIENLKKHTGFEEHYTVVAKTKPNSANQKVWFILRMTALKLNKNHKDFHFSVYRVGSKHCPVEVDLSEWSAMDKNILPKDKYNYRNCKFKIKEYSN